MPDSLINKELQAFCLLKTVKVGTITLIYIGVKDFHAEKC